MRKIGLANQFEGLYYLKFSEVKLNPNGHAIDIDPIRLWHWRLGHLSHDRTIILNKRYNYISILAKASCDVFHMEKNRLPYTLSHSNAKQVFDLIHVDIWGPLFII